MLNYFEMKRRTKAVQNISQLIFASLFDLLEIEQGKLPLKLKDDPFIIAYIYGLIGFISVIFNIKSERQKGFLIIDVFNKLFPGYGMDITGKCNQLIRNSNSKFLDTVKIALSEIEIAHKNKGNGNLPSLKIYVEKNKNILL